MYNLLYKFVHSGFSVKWWQIIINGIAAGSGAYIWVAWLCDSSFCGFLAGLGAVVFNFVGLYQDRPVKKGGKYAY